MVLYVLFRCCTDFAVRFSWWIAYNNHFQFQFRTEPFRPRTEDGYRLEGCVRAEAWRYVRLWRYVGMVKVQEKTWQTNVRWYILMVFNDDNYILLATRFLFWVVVECCRYRKIWYTMMVYYTIDYIVRMLSSRKGRYRAKGKTWLNQSRSLASWREMQMEPTRQGEIYRLSTTPQKNNENHPKSAGSKIFGLANAHPCSCPNCCWLSSPFAGSWGFHVVVSNRL